MWTNLQNRKIFKSVKVCYQINGLNQDRLISELKRRGIELYSVKKASNRLMYASVNLNQSENFFAITKNLCYNIKKVRLYGKGLPIFKLVTNLGLVLGTLFFLCFSILANDLILGVSFSGNGSVYKREVLDYLSSKEIVEGSRFSSIKLERLEDEILAQNPNLTFVSVQKKGNVLSVYLTLKNQSVNVISGKAKELRAEGDGVVESIKVYRGTPTVKVGDSVRVGDLLVDGYAVIKEQTVQTGVLASVTLLQRQSFTYRLQGEKSQEQALVLAEQELYDREIVLSAVTVKEISGKPDYYEYTVILEYRSVFYAN